MHVPALSVDLNWLLQFVISALLIFFGLVYLLKNTTSKYFVVDGTFDSHPMPASASSGRTSMACVDMNSAGGTSTADRCAVCGKTTTKNCSGCKAVKYCSVSCQREHWQSGHQKKCKVTKENTKPSSSWRGLSLVPSIGLSKAQKQVDKVLYPYDDFVYLFNWDKGAFPPCGLLNCGNSCYANVILQCLAHTRPLVAYLLERGHRRECRRNEWCFFCELQRHIERAIQSQQPFSPINILSRLPSIGSNLGYGRQEDAHEFMRFAVDTMQSVCLDEHGGEKMIHPKAQETTIIQHIFGGQLQSQVICAQCHQVSNQYENMMDLTVEIQGNATSLEECLDQFTVKECLEGDNLYKCDRCNDYVKACKRLTIRQAPNILTIALKRFESGRFGKLNKRITFPEYLDLTPYVSEEGDGMDKYKLFAVVVHIDMLNASFFGHYICYTKDFQGSWFRIDDSKVAGVELDEVLSQGAYMLLYSRVCARPTCLKSFEASGKQCSEADESSSETKQNRLGDVLDSDSVVSTKSHTESSCSVASQVTIHSNSLIQDDTHPQPAVREIEGRSQERPPYLETFKASERKHPGVDELVFEAKQNGPLNSDSGVPTESHTESSSWTSHLSDGSLLQEETYREIKAGGQDPTASAIPVSRNVEVVEDEEALAVNHSAFTLTSSSSEARTLTTKPLSNGSCGNDLSTPSEAETEPPMSCLNGEDRRIVNDRNGSCNGFGQSVFSGDIDDPSGSTILESNFECSGRNLDDREVESTGTTGAANVYNGNSSWYPAGETDSTKAGSRVDLCSDDPENVYMEIDPVEINGSVNLNNSLPSCISLDTARTIHHDQDMQCSTAVKKCRRDVDEMDIDDTCVN